MTQAFLLSPAHLRRENKNGTTSGLFKKDHVRAAVESSRPACLEGYLETADSQFGFKSSHGTEMAIFSLKQTVAYYRETDSPVYLCFLDARKAFDRVNHWTLHRELLDTRYTGRQCT